MKAYFKCMKKVVTVICHSGNMDDFTKTILKALKKCNRVQVHSDPEIAKYAQWFLDTGSHHIQYSRTVAIIVQSVFRDILPFSRYIHDALAADLQDMARKSFRCFGTYVRTYHYVSTMLVH